MVNIPGYDIRFTTLEDATHLKQWFSAPDVLYWFPASEGKELDDAIQCWIGFSRYQAGLTAVVNDVPVGNVTLFLMPYRKVAHHALFKIAVDPAYQRQGIGTSLLKNIKHLAKTKFRLESIYIEIFEGNPILHLLQKNGFKEFVRQAKYVKEPDGTYKARIILETIL